MSEKKQTGLGRGLNELFQATAPAKTAGQAAKAAQSAATMSDASYLAELPLNQITPNPDQPRTVFDEDQLAELAASIAEVGLLQPVVVRPLGRNRYELVMGERRWRAAELAGLAAIPAIVRHTQETDRLRDALLENIHRVQLNPLEEAAAYQQLLTDFGLTQDELAARLKKSRPQVSNTIRLLKLPAAVQRRVAAGVLSAGHARALLALDDAALMDRLAQRIVAEGLSVRATEELVTLGASEPEPKARPAKTAVPDPKAAELSEKLSDKLDTRVRVDIGKAKGKITIEFAGEADLDRILAALKLL
jgi:ParB family chromosome partitioning protein